MKIYKKIALSNKIFPFYRGLSLDLMFWAAISTIFLTTVKDFTSSEVNSLISISVLTVIIGYYLVLRIIQKIGRINAIKVGNILLLLGGILITFLKGYHGVLLGFILYQYSSFFKSMDNAILKNNLKYINEEDKFFEYQSKSTLIYSISTLIIAFFSGYIFNINNYLPMYISIAFCILNCILMNFIYEAPVKETKKEKIKGFKFNKIIVFILLFFVLYQITDCGQTNTKLLLQYNMEEFLNHNNTVLILGFIIFLSRIGRVLSNIVFNKLYDKLKNKLSIIINIMLIISYALILFGNFIKMEYVGIIFISIGFIMFLIIRDPLENYTRTILLENTENKFHDKILIYLALVREIATVVLGLIISSILLKHEMKYAFIFLFILTVLFIYVSFNVFKTLKNKY